MCAAQGAKNIHVVALPGAHTHTHMQSHTKNPPKVKPWNEVTLVECSRLRKIELRRQEGMSNREG